MATLYENLTIESGSEIESVARQLANAYESRHASEGLSCLIMLTASSDQGWGEPHLSATYAIEGENGKCYYLAAVGAFFHTDPAGGVTVTFLDMPMDGMAGAPDAGKHQMLRQFIRQALSLANMLEGEIRQAVRFL